jgi:hypothetical protein
MTASCGHLVMSVFRCFALLGELDSDVSLISHVTHTLFFFLF